MSNEATLFVALIALALAIISIIGNRSAYPFNEEVDETEPEPTMEEKVNDYFAGIPNKAPNLHLFSQDTCQGWSVTNADANQILRAEGESIHIELFDDYATLYVGDREYDIHGFPGNEFTVARNITTGAALLIIFEADGTPALYGDNFLLSPSRTLISFTHQKLINTLTDSEEELGVKLLLNDAFQTTVDITIQPGTVATDIFLKIHNPQTDSSKLAFKGIDKNTCIALDDIEDIWITRPDGTVLTLSATDDKLNSPFYVR